MLSGMADAPLASAARHGIRALLGHPVRQQQQHFPQGLDAGQQGDANMDTLIAIGAGAAWAYSIPGVFRMHHHVYFESAAGICTFVLLGRYMEERAKGKAGEAIRKLIELQPETALRVRPMAANRKWVSTRSSRRPSARAGRRQDSDRWPCSRAAPAVDEAMITGESLPVAKAVGDSVIGGCLNGNGSFTMRVTAIGGDTVLSGIVKLVDQAQGSKAAGAKAGRPHLGALRPGGRRRCGADLCRLGCWPATRCHARWRIPWRCC
jgi:Cu+-exporting ATPase